MQVELPLVRDRAPIRPYHADPLRRYHLVQADAAETLAKIPDRSVDLLFADPPYGLSNGGTTCSGGERVAVDKGKWDASRGLAEDLAFQRRWLEQAQLVLKPSGTIWVSGTHHCLFIVGYAMQELGFHVLNLVTWMKPNASPHLACRYFTHSAEHLIWAAPSRRDPLPYYFDYVRAKKIGGGKQLRDTWSIPTTPKREKAHGTHPTIKPMALLDRIISTTSAPGDLVVDPFCGSGTTGVCAVRGARRFIGVDLDSGYLDLTRRRIDALSVSA